MGTQKSAKTPPAVGKMIRPFCPEILSRNSNRNFVRNFVQKFKQKFIQKFKQKNRNSNFNQSLQRQTVSILSLENLSCSEFRKYLQRSTSVLRKDKNM